MADKQQRWWSERFRNCLTVVGQIIFFQFFTALLQVKKPNWENKKKKYIYIYVSTEENLLRYFYASNVILNFEKSAVSWKK